MDETRRVIHWGYPLRVLGKAALLFLLFNLLFAAFVPVEALGRISLYGRLLPGRLRLPYGENSAASHNVSLYNVPAMLGSMALPAEKADDEYRVLLIGDSASWGWFLENDDTLAAQISALNLRTDSGQRVTVTSLGYPVMSLTKDLMFLDAVQDVEADLILWPVTLESFPREKQLFAPIVQNNPDRVRPLINTYDLKLDPFDSRFVDPVLWEKTIVGERRNLADLIRLQLYGFSWAATRVDQFIPADIPLRRSDFDDDLTWGSYAEPRPLGPDELALEVLDAGRLLAGATPVLLVNEPMYISSGANSDLRYNSFYPRWAYDQYRDLLEAKTTAEDWHYLDLWDKVPAQEFTDTPVHMTPAGVRQTAALIGTAVLDIANR
jgi:hypothetical protein